MFFFVQRCEICREEFEQFWDEEEEEWKLKNAIRVNDMVSVLISFSTFSPFSMANHCIIQFINSLCLLHIKTHLIVTFDVKKTRFNALRVMTRKLLSMKIVCCSSNECQSKIAKEAKVPEFLINN